MASAGYNLYLQQGAGNYEGIEESDLSQQSEDSQKLILAQLTTVCDTIHS